MGCPKLTYHSQNTLLTIVPGGRGDAQNFTGGYIFGFNGMEKDDEVSGAGNSYTAEYWQYDPRLGRRFNIDPVVKPWESPYATFSNNPIVYADQNGLDPTPTGKPLEPEKPFYPTPTGDAPQDMPDPNRGTLRFGAASPDVVVTFPKDNTTVAPTPQGHATDPKPWWITRKIVAAIDWFNSWRIWKDGTSSTADEGNPKGKQEGGVVWMDPQASHAAGTEATETIYHYSYSGPLINTINASKGSRGGNSVYDGRWYKGIAQTGANTNETINQVQTESGVISNVAEGANNAHHYDTLNLKMTNRKYGYSYDFKVIRKDVKATPNLATKIE